MRDPCLSRVDGVMTSFYWCYLENGEVRTKKSAEKKYKWVQDIGLDQSILIVDADADDDNDKDDDNDGNDDDDFL